MDVTPNERLQGHREGTPEIRMRLNSSLLQSCSRHRALKVTRHLSFRPCTFTKLKTQEYKHTIYLFFTKRIEFIKHCKSLSIINRWTTRQDSTSRKHSQKTPKLSDCKPTASFPWFRATCPNLHWLKNPTTYGAWCGVQGLGRWGFVYQGWGSKDNIYPSTKNRC